MNTPTTLPHTSRAASAETPDERWNELCERHRPLLLQQAFALLGCREDAEDVLQETFCEALRNPAALADEAAAGNWLKLANRRNALNKLRDVRLRRQKVRERQQRAPVRDFTTGGFNLLELRESLKKLLRPLPSAMRACVQLHYWEHLSCKQVAERLQLPEGSVKRLLYEANLRMYQMLNEQSGGAKS